jgi:hypothetical protein
MEGLLIIMFICWFVTLQFWNVEHTKRKIYENRIQEKEDLIDVLKNVIDDCNRQIGQLKMKLKMK